MKINLTLQNLYSRLKGPEIQAIALHEANLRGVEGALSDFNLKTPLETYEVPGLGKFWTSDSVRRALHANQSNHEVVKEISLGLAEQLKKTARFIDAVFVLAKSDSDLKGVVTSTTHENKLDLETADGYRFTNYAHSRWQPGQRGGIGVNFSLDSRQGAMMVTPSNDTLAKYLQVARIDNVIERRNEGGWLPGFNIATIALANPRGETLLVEDGSDNDAQGSPALKISSDDYFSNEPTKITVRALDEHEIFNPVNHSLRGGQEALFRQAA